METQNNKSSFKGAVASLLDPRTLNLSDYLTISKLNIPAAIDWTAKKTTPWGMMGNWELADCTCASAGHMIECWTANSNTEYVIEDNAVITAYSALSGYDPATGNNSQQGVMYTNLLKYWRKQGIGNHKIKAYTAVKYIKPEMVKATIYLFGGAYAGFNLPKSCSTDDDIWELKPGGLTGDNAPTDGHAVPVFAYDDKYLVCVSWGKVKKITWDFWNAYATECYAVITDDFLNNGKTPLGFDVAAMEADLLRVSREKAVLVNNIVKEETNQSKTSKPDKTVKEESDKSKTIKLDNLEVMAHDLGKMNWQQAIDACNALGNGWHLPTQDELNTVYQNKAKIGGFSTEKLAGYWSSTLHGVIISNNQDDSYRYYQIFDSGDQYTDNMNTELFVRAVRSIK